MRFTKEIKLNFPVAQIAALIWPKETTSNRTTKLYRKLKGESTWHIDEFKKLVEIIGQKSKELRDQSEVLNEDLAKFLEAA